MRKINNNGLDLIKHYEGLRLEAYQCSAGVWTIGYGSTRGVKPGMVIDEAEAEHRLRVDVAFAEIAVNKLVTVDLTDDQHAALVSFVFNLGAGNFGKSTLLRKLNAGDYEGAADEFPRWCRTGGRVLAGLKRRREAEKALFLGDGLLL